MTPHEFESLQESLSNDERFEISTLFLAMVLHGREHDGEGGYTIYAHGPSGAGVVTCEQCDYSIPAQSKFAHFLLGQKDMLDMGLLEVKNDD